MSELKKRILADMKSAMKERDAQSLETVRMIRAAIQRRELDDRKELDDNGVLQVIQKLMKQSMDAASQFADGGRDDLVETEQGRVRVLKQYLPESISDDELSQLIEQAISETAAESMKDMGKVMGFLKPRVQGRADMGALSGRIRERLG